MIALTLEDVLVHQVNVPWPELYQVEQDLLLSLTICAIFQDKFLSAQVAMRGGTVLHKVHLAPAARYSEDVDLVVVGERPEQHIKKALMRVLRGVLGKEQSSAWMAMKLAVRNAARPSRILRCVFRVPSVAETGRMLIIEVEVNVTERTPRFELQRLPFELEFRGNTALVTIVSYNINEMLGTKMRAMFQRKKGRDLFDLYWALTSQSTASVDPGQVVLAFTHYMQDEDTHVSRQDFLAHLHECVADKAGFCQDMAALLKHDLNYQPEEAASTVESRLLALLP
ncbi:MAG: nucleotidyl transferase AbiEii/AbiGii toxin family protein [Gammaproteobacteria bacterium]